MDYHAVVDRILKEKNLVIALEDLYENCDQTDLINVKEELTKHLNTLQSNIEEKLSKNDDIFAHLKDYLINTDKKLKSEVDELAHINELLKSIQRLSAENHSKLSNKEIFERGFDRHKNINDTDMDDSNTDLSDNLSVYEAFLDSSILLKDIFAKPNVNSKLFGSNLYNFLGFLSIVHNSGICNRHIIQENLDVEANVDECRFVEQCAISYITNLLQTNQIEDNVSLIILFSECTEDIKDIRASEYYDDTGYIRLIEKTSDDKKPILIDEEVFKNMINVGLEIAHKNVISYISSAQFDAPANLFEGNKLLLKIRNSSIEANLKTRLLNAVEKRKSEIQAVSLTNRLKNAFFPKDKKQEVYKSIVIDDKAIGLLDQLTNDYSTESLKSAFVELLTENIESLSNSEPDGRVQLHIVYNFVLISVYKIYFAGAGDELFNNFTTELSSTANRIYKEHSDEWKLKIFSQAFDFFRSSIEFLNARAKIKKIFVEDVLNIKIPELEYIRYRKRFPCLFDFNLTGLDIMYQQIDRRKLRN